MKNDVSFLMAFCLLCGVFSVCALASTKDYSTNRNVTAIGGVTECEYVSETKKINISGNIDHDFLIDHSRYYLALYAIPYGTDYIEYINSKEAVQVTKSDISVKFEFSIKAETNLEKFSTYCVVAMNDEGDIIPIDTPKFPIVKCTSKFILGDKSSFKGVQTELTSLAVSSNATSAIVPVELNKLLSNTSVGHIYSMHGSYLYFDKEYINELDIRVRSLTASGSAVYLRFLLDGGEGSSVSLYGDSDIPDMSYQQNVDMLVAFTDFLTDRYNDRYSGTITGIILGRNIDTAFERSGANSVFDYAENYFRYMTIVSSVANQVVDRIEVTVPLSDADSYSTSDFDGKCAPSELLDILCYMMDDKYVSQFYFSTLVESDLLPYGLTDDTLTSGSLICGNEGRLSADKMSVFSKYINNLRSKYENAPSSYIFIWNVNEGLSYNVLSTAYAYSYFKLMSDDSLSSFIVSFENEEYRSIYTSFPLISEIVKKIDTAESFTITKPQLSFLKADSWYKVVSDMYGGNFNRYEIIDLKPLDELPTNMIGSYPYFDFSYHNDISAWFGGSYCDKLKIDYSDVSGRALKAHISGEFSSPSEYAQLYCAYEYHENFVFTPYLSLNFSVENDARDKYALYDVVVSYGSRNSVVSTNVVCSPYEEIEVILDLSDHIEIATAEYITISIRCLSGYSGGYTLCLASMDGYSDTYVSDELSSLIAEERLRIQNMLKNDSSSEAKSINTVLLVAGVAAVVFVIAIGIFMCFKKDDSEDEE